MLFSHLPPVLLPLVCTGCWKHMVFVYFYCRDLDRYSLEKEEIQEEVRRVFCLFFF